jgi:hypothetical protein
MLAHLACHVLHQAVSQLDALTADMPGPTITPRLCGIETGRIIAW